ncbi:MAG: PLP-dependent aspartate aminotransferase family protein [Cytophagales bacterium]|nr:PLP-dependent aspartate aminotransferase family protein [Cytophagales bacterium]
MDSRHIIYQLGEEFETDAIPGSPPIHQTSNYLFNSVKGMQAALREEHGLPFYTRGTNPTVQLLSKKIAALESMEDALVFGSGSAAISSALLSFLKAGDHVVCTASPYSWTGKLMRNWLSRFQVAVDFFGPEDDLKQALKSNTRLIYLESPNSWTFEAYDLQTVGQLARKMGILTILDNSYATPLLQRPAEASIDLVVHSATKYLGGHSDLVAGVVCGSTAHITTIFKEAYMTLGGIISPNDAWLLLRSLRTLPQRLEAIQKSTKSIMGFLLEHPVIQKVHYPQSPSQSLKDMSGLFTIDLKTDDTQKVEQFCDAFKVFKLGPSWGSFHSLIFPAITTINSMNYHAEDTVAGRIRISIGLEDETVLIEDLSNALDLLS